jgi:hypothetical protein
VSRAEGDAVAHGALRIEVGEERPDAAPGEGGGEVHRGRRLADAALLADDRERASHRHSVPGEV